MKEKEVMTGIRQRLEVYQMSGEVVWFCRLQSGMVRLGLHYMRLAEEGTPDFVCVIRNHSNNLSLLFFEAKGEGGRLRLSQIKFQKKYTGFKDVTYFVIDDPHQVGKILCELTYDRVKDINL